MATELVLRRMIETIEETRNGYQQQRNNLYREIEVMRQEERALDRLLEAQRNVIIAIEALIECQTPKSAPTEIG